MNIRSILRLKKLKYRDIVPPNHFTFFKMAPIFILPFLAAVNAHFCSFIEIYYEHLGNEHEVQLRGVELTLASVPVLDRLNNEFDTVQYYEKIDSLIISSLR